MATHAAGLVADLVGFDELGVDADASREPVRATNS
jgi:hypothetical protein